MYENFLAAYPADDGDGEHFSSSPLEELGGFRELMAIGAGRSFGGGLLRVHDQGGSGRAAQLIEEAFPEYRGAVVPIAKDWLGRQYAVPLVGAVPRAGMVLLVEPGSGEAFEVDCNLVELFDQEMVDDPVTFLATDLYAEWKPANPGSIPPGKCVGFKVPLFLGGEGNADNLEVVDEPVYWSLFGQLRREVR
jgi:Domain of unknown function (DUF1851)